MLKKSTYCSTNSRSFYTNSCLEWQPMCAYSYKPRVQMGLNTNLSFSIATLELQHRDWQMLNARTLCSEIPHMVSCTAARTSNPWLLLHVLSEIFIQIHQFLPRSHARKPQEFSLSKLSVTNLATFGGNYNWYDLIHSYHSSAVRYQQIRV